MNFAQHRADRSHGNVNKSVDDKGIGFYLNDWMIKLNLGSGFEAASGRIHLEANPMVTMARWPRLLQLLAFKFMKAKEFYSFEQLRWILNNHKFIRHDLEEGIPFAKESIDHIFSSHFVEHLFKDDARQLFREMYRVLKPTGVARIAVPDLAYAVSLYQARQKEKALEMFFVDSGGGERTRHRYMYDFELLSDELRSAGFCRIERCGYRQGVTPDLLRLDNRPDETLYVEAFKSKGAIADSEVPVNHNQEGVF